MIVALLGLGDLITNVNIPNIGQMKSVPMNAVVETNALLRKDSMAPVFSGSLPGKVNDIMNVHIDNQETIIRAVKHKNLDLAFKAFKNDPMINLDESEARVLFQKMIDNTKSYLAYFD